MRKIKFILPLFFVFFSSMFLSVNIMAENKSTSISTADLNGTWIMSGIEANDIVEIYITKDRTEKADNSGVEKNKSEKVSIPLKKILQNELSIGNTKFVFNNGTFDFYRKSSLTFSGNWVLNANELTLKFKSANNENVKHNKIITLTDKLLVMESESYNKKVVFTFIKK